MKEITDAEFLPIDPTEPVEEYELIPAPPEETRAHTGN